MPPSMNFVDTHVPTISFHDLSDSTNFTQLKWQGNFRCIARLEIKVFQSNLFANLVWANLHANAFTPPSSIRATNSPHVMPVLNGNRGGRS
jgi:hypothetical protein